MSNPFTVRAAEERDVDQIIALVKASWARTYDPVIGAAARAEISDKKHVPKLFLSEIRDENAAAVVAVSDAGNVIGHTGGQIRGDRIFFIDHFHVALDWHGQGAASAVLEGLKAEVRSIADHIELTVLENNHRAIGFYQKNGFYKTSGANEDDGLAGVGSYLMRLDLHV